MSIICLHGGKAIELSSEKVFLQEPEYLFYNPITAGICPAPGDYHFSSALLQEKPIDHFEMLSHYMG